MELNFDIATRLIKWHKMNARILPWRARIGQAKNPWHILLSEIMLQQTTVATVIDYFNRFIERWPDLPDFAAASIDDVLWMWQGLGYYSRARNLHAAACQIMREFNGIIPDSYEALISLPGIGPYTAAAIASIGFKRQEAIVDGNVERVLSRLLKIETPLPQSKPEIKKYAVCLTPIKDPDYYAEAIMDLGAVICTPKSPKCLLCPLQESCLAFKDQCSEQYPKKRPKKDKPIIKAYFFKIESEGHIMLEKKVEQGMLRDLWSLPSTPWGVRSDLPENPFEYAPIKGLDYQKQDLDFKHSFTHFHLRGSVYFAQAPQKEEGFHWAPQKHLGDYAMPVFMNKILKSD